MTTNPQYQMQSFQYDVLATVDGMQRCRLKDGQDFDAFWCEHQKAKCIRISRREFIQRVPPEGIGLVRSEA